MSVKSKIALIKYNTLKLRANYQLPSYLTYLILKLDGKEETSYVKTLMALTTHMMRTKNYYKQYPLIDKEMNQTVKNELSKLGF